VKTLMLVSNRHFDRWMLSVVLAFEAILFCNFYSREIAWYPPQNFDQAAYLKEAYQLQERIVGNGLGEIWKDAQSRSHPTGLLLPIEGALSGLVLGGTRWPQLAVNFVLFGVLQVVAFYAARNAWDSRTYGYAVVGLILSQSTTWLPCGGLFDFRMDFSAYCLYGIWCCAVIRSKLFLDRRRAIECGLIGALLVLTRFLTVVYLLGVCAGVAGILAAVGILWRSNANFPRWIWNRFSNLSLSVGLVGVIVAPILVLNSAAIHDYYVIGHAVGEEKNIRAKEAGLTNLTDHLLYYPKSIVLEHLGATFFYAAVIAIAGASASRLATGRNNVERNPASRRDETFFLETSFLIGTILGPIIVLTADTSKSMVVGGITGVPAALLLLAVTARVAVPPRDFARSAAQRLIVACSLLVFALGLFNQLGHASRHLTEYVERRDLERLKELDNWLVDYAGKHDWRNPAISFDVISGWLNASAITASGYEQSRQLIEFHPMLGNGIMGVGEPDAVAGLAKSDIAILTTLPKVGVYPFYQHIAQYWNDLKAWADENMILIRAVSFDGFTAIVYARPSAIISGLSDGWIARDGLLVEAPRVVLERFPKIRLSRQTDYPELLKTPTVSATVDAVDGQTPAQARFTRIDTGYEIVVDTSSIELPPSNNVILRLHFDSSLVLKSMVPGDQTREPVVRAPTLVQLIRNGS
jgi:hypothetical protein